MDILSATAKQCNISNQHPCYQGHDRFNELLFGDICLDQNWVPPDISQIISDHQVLPEFHDLDTCSIEHLPISLNQNGIKLFPPNKSISPNSWFPLTPLRNMTLGPTIPCFPERINWKPSGRRMARRRCTKWSLGLMLVAVNVCTGNILDEYVCVHIYIYIYVCVNFYEPIWNPSAWNCFSGPSSLGMILVSDGQYWKIAKIQNYQPV